MPMELEDKKEAVSKALKGTSFRAKSWN